MLILKESAEMQQVVMEKNGEENGMWKMPLWLRGVSTPWLSVEGRSGALSAFYSAFFAFFPNQSINS